MAIEYSSHGDPSDHRTRQEVFEQSDFVICSLPGGEATYHACGVPCAWKMTDKNDAYPGVNIEKDVENTMGFLKESRNSGFSASMVISL